MNLSPLQKARYEYSPKLPGMLRGGISEICVSEGSETQSVADQEKISALFPNTYGKKEITFCRGQNTAPAKKQAVGVILSGGQAPGGHNVVCGLYDALKATDPENILYGFKNGPSGLLDDDYIVFDDAYINNYRNTGGFDIIGSGRTKLETKEQFAVAAEACKKHGITAIVIIGGDDSNTNAAVLAEYFAANNTGVQVIGCPKTIDGDLKNEISSVPSALIPRPRPTANSSATLKETLTPPRNTGTSSRLWAVPLLMLPWSALLRPSPISA